MSGGSFFLLDLCKLDFGDICADVQWASGWLCHRLAQFLENIASSALRPSYRQKRPAKLGKTRARRGGNGAAFKIRDTTSRYRLPSTVTKKKNKKNTRTALLTLTLRTRLWSLLECVQTHNYEDLIHAILFKREAALKRMWRCVCCVALHSRHSTKHRAGTSQLREQQTLPTPTRRQLLSCRNKIESSSWRFSVV